MKDDNQPADPGQESPDEAAPMSSKALVRAADALREERRFESITGKAQGKAESLAKDLASDDAEDDPKRRAKLHGFVDDLRAVLRLVRAYRAGDYKAIDRTTVVLLMAALIYFVNPFDLIPDAFGLPGFLDDAAVLAFATSIARDELDAFFAWEQRQDGRPS